MCRHVLVLIFYKASIFIYKHAFSSPLSFIYPTILKPHPRMNVVCYEFYSESFVIWSVNLGLIVVETLPLHLTLVFLVTLAVQYWSRGTKLWEACPVCPQVKLDSIIGWCLARYKGYFWAVLYLCAILAAEGPRPKQLSRCFKLWKE